MNGGSRGETADKDVRNREVTRLRIGATGSETPTTTAPGHDKGRTPEDHAP